jgi:hypothetical protein
MSTQQGQLSVFDGAASAAARDRSMKQVEEHADPNFKDAAYEAVCITARLQPEGFIVDEVWRNLPAGVVQPREPRAMGPVMSRAKRDGVIVPTNEFRASARVTAHRNPRRVWKAK